MTETIRIGTRKSDLALWQANYVKNCLLKTYPNAHIEIVTHTTQGDKILDQPLAQIGGKGVFTAELETALLAGEIDCAVHSLKDLPTDNPSGLTIGAVTERARVNDVLISRAGLLLDDLPSGATIGTSSLRRASQLMAHRDDLTVIDIRGNVPTRIAKALDPNGAYDAIILAQAGVQRLNLMHKITQILPLEMMLPAPGQGALAVQCRADDTRFASLTHRPTLACVTAERVFLSALGGGCAVPVAAYAKFKDDELTLHGRVGALDGSHTIDVDDAIPFEFDDENALSKSVEIGQRVGKMALELGADNLLAGRI
ncbi:MAG: hydroxymethylbilane synthase [Aggregatilineales bacterium]